MWDTEPSLARQLIVGEIIRILMEISSDGYFWLDGDTVGPVREDSDDV